MRFRKGTLDHDGDGRMGGSMKESDMDKPTEKNALKDTAKAVEATTPKEAPKAKDKPSRTSAHTAKSGMEPGAPPKERRAEINRQFDEADEKAKAAIIDETQIGLQVRGY